MKIKENLKNKNFKKLTKSGISLIVLVITIIVIIILAAAIIISLNNNNPIMEANKARYDSDVANMQAVFTNAVAKVMAKNQATVSVSAGQINTITGGVKETDGQVAYTLTDAQNVNNATGKIVFDNNKLNTDTEFYTGKKLPIYAAGETKWYVDEEGNISLEVAGTKYGNGVVVEGVKEGTFTLLSGSEFNSIIPDTVTSITFTDEVAPNSAELTDVSVAQDKSIVMWIEGASMKVSTQQTGIKIIANENCSSMFSGKNNLTSIEFNKIDTSKVTNMDSMFGCKGITSLDLSTFDTSNVTSMSVLFGGCENLTTVNLSSFNTSKVTNMSYMFVSCSNLSGLNLNNFDTSSVTNMFAMFCGCEKIVGLELDSFVTTNVISMAAMFDGCKSLVHVDVSSFNTSNVTSMYNMFDDCVSLPRIDLSSFDTSKVTGTYSMEDMFKNCTSINSGQAWARTDEDANRLNNSSGKPTSWRFTKK